MTNKVINIIRPIDYGAEKEYLKEFFRFIGCFLSDVAVDTTQVRAWNRALAPSNEESGVDIVINYFGEDPYALECRFRKIRRIYCYFSYQKYEHFAYVTDRPCLSADAAPQKHVGNELLRYSILTDLIFAVWADEPEALSSVWNIANLYTDAGVQGNTKQNKHDDLFFYIQARRSLRFLKMSEVLDAPHAYVEAISFQPYIRQCLSGLWQMWVQLENFTDPYSRYTQVKAGKMMRDIVSTLQIVDRFLTREIEFQGLHLQVPSIEDLASRLRLLLDQDPQFLSAQMYLAGLSRYSEDGEQEVVRYKQVLRQVPQGKWHYAFIWYRIGHYYEKTVGNISEAVRCYKKTVESDPQHYQALFKLGYYAATDGRFKEAEQFLNQTIRAVFHGRSTEAAPDGTYPNWLALSLKESQYIFKTYMMLAKVAINSNREYSAKSFIGKACMAATRFEEASLVRHAASPDEFNRFHAYHQMSEYVWAIWKVLEPWTEGIVLDYYLRMIVREKLARWPISEKSQSPARRSSIITELRNTKRMDV